MLSRPGMVRGNVVGHKIKDQKDPPLRELPAGNCQPLRAAQMFID